MSLARICVRAAGSAWFAIGILPGLAWLSGCASGEVVVRQAMPNPFVAGPALCARPPRLDGLQVDGRSEAEWLASRVDEQRTRYEADRATYAAALAQELANKGIPECGAHVASGYIVQPWMETLQTGMVTWTATDVWGVLIVHDAQNAVQDEVRLRVVVAATLKRPTFSERMKEAGREMGERIADYLRRRKAGGPTKQ